jgi:desulfoferrodoxin (superoxide reductase-like protein)
MDAKKIKKLLVLSVFLFSGVALMANKTGVKLEAQETAEKGEEVTVTIHIKHVGNSSKHYTDWVWVKVNGEEVKKWTYTPDTLPDSQSFDLTFTVTADETLEIVAKGNCNKHGSTGEDKITIKVE